MTQLPMAEKEFLKLCEIELNNLFDKIEELDKHSKLEIDYSDGILSIEIIEEKKTYIINRNSGNQKIWYSSPISGADYFSFHQEKKIWLNDKNIDLSSKLIKELKNFI